MQCNMNTFLPILILCKTTQNNSLIQSDAKHAQYNHLISFSSFHCWVLQCIDWTSVAVSGKIYLQLTGAGESILTLQKLHSSPFHLPPRSPTQTANRNRKGLILLIMSAVLCNHQPPPPFPWLALEQAFLRVNKIIQMSSFRRCLHPTMAPEAI